jgi:RNA-splicing ligase RtcB
MLEVSGRYNQAKIFTDVVDQASIAQVIELCNQEFTVGSRIRLMPDVHAGAGCTVGTTMTITDKVVPNLVGVDIGCGMETARIREDHIELQKLDKLIYEKIPSGFAVRPAVHRYAGQIDLEELYCAKHIQMLRAEKSIGTLGGGNHFIEVDRDDEGRLYVIVHSGSRRLGLEVATYYQEEGYKVLNRTDEASLDQLIAEMKAAGRQKEIQKELKRRKSQKLAGIPRQLAYVSGALFDQYIHDMKIVQRFAELNRQAMMDEIVKGMKLHVEEQFTTIHNYIDTDAMILRKGAVSAKAGEQILIPINMRDGSLLCVGKGNEDWNCSAPHGAGRLMSRGEAKQTFTVSEFKKQMDGIYTTSVGRATLDECPMAYKGMEDILENIGPTAEVARIIRPIYNFKAGDTDG